VAPARGVLQRPCTVIYIAAADWLVRGARHSVLLTDETTRHGSERVKTHIHHFLTCEAMTIGTEQRSEA